MRGTRRGWEGRSDTPSRRRQLAEEKAMTYSPAAPISSRILEVPGAHLHYEVRGQGPLIALVGAPMDADSFIPLADLLASDFCVLTADPRGIKRSLIEDPERD